MINLKEAALEGDVAALRRLLEADPLLLERRTLGSLFSAETPLHVAILRGHTAFALELLDRQPRLAESRDESGTLPLHLASAGGHADLVLKIIKMQPSLCISTDNQGRTCVHLAAINGQVHVLKQVLNLAIFSNDKGKEREKKITLARQVTSQGDTPLHLCVKHNQVEAAKFLIEKDEELLNLPDGGGNTVLHLAVVRKQTQVVKVLLDVPKVDVNARNDYNFTPLDVLLQSPSHPSDREITEALLSAGASKSQKQNRVRSRSRTPSTFRAAVNSLLKNNWYKRDDGWLEDMHNTLILVATLIATITFQTGLNPPGSVWQDDDDGKVRPGTAIGNDTRFDNFRLFMYFDMIGLAASLGVILMLVSGLPLKNRASTWLLVIAMWIALSSMALAFAFGTFIITVSENILRAIPYILFIWLGLLASILVIHCTALAISLWRKHRVPVNEGRAMENAGDLEAGNIEIRA